MGHLICLRCSGEVVAVRHENHGDRGLMLIAVLVGTVGLLFWPLLLVAGILALLAVVRMVVSQAKALRVSHYECPHCGVINRR